MDTSRNILRNYAAMTLVSIGFLLFALWVAYAISGVLPYLCLFFGICLSSFFPLCRPPNMFFIPELWTDRKMELRELDQPSLRVLAFFKSRKAKRIVLSISFVLTLVVILAWYVSNRILPDPKLTPEQASLESRLTGSLGFGLFFAMSTFGVHIGILSRYILKHWDRIQQEYEPWPVDKPFNRSLKFWVSKRENAEVGTGFRRDR